MIARATVVAVLLGGCLASNVVPCSDGTECPGGRACVSVTTHDGPRSLCVDPKATCGGAEGSMCGVGASCHSGACLLDSCGNGLVDSAEACDDGNTRDGDGCAADCHSDETCGNDTVDFSVGEQCDSADHIDHDGCASACETAELPAWSSVYFQKRSEPAIAFDPDRARIVMYGGDDYEVTHEPQNDTWEWDGLAFVPRTVASAPQVTPGCAIAYDADHHQLVMFQRLTASTWLLAGRGWHKAQPAHHPTNRDFPAMTYDAARHRVMLVGGSQSGTPINDTWTWDGTDWTQLQPATLPPLARDATLAYDPVRQVDVLVGGTNAAETIPNEAIYEFDGSDWHARVPTLGALVVGAAWNPTTSRTMIVTAPNTAVEWDGTTLTPVTGPPLAGTSGTFLAMASDTARGHVVAVGFLESAPLGGELYDYDGATQKWSTITTGAHPSDRVLAGLTVDEKRRIAVMFGGQASGGGSTYGDTWLWDGTWLQLPAQASPPPAREAPAIAYDPIRDQLVMFGGLDSSAKSLADTWVFDVATRAWTKRTPAHAPGPRALGTLAFDGQRLVLFGGANIDGLGATFPTDPTWTWDGSDWTHEAAADATAPTQALDVAMALDRRAGTLVMFDGEIAATWVWDATARTWSMTAQTDGPLTRSGAGVVWDAGRRRLVLAGGALTGSNEAAGDVWDWNAATASWELAGSPATPIAQQAMFIPALDGAGIIAIQDDPMFDSLDEAWRLRWDGADRDEACGPVDTDGDKLVGCDDPDCWAHCTPLMPPTTPLPQ